MRVDSATACVSSPTCPAVRGFPSGTDIDARGVRKRGQEEGGSISAEHGIGIMKRDDLAQRANPVKIKLLSAVKTALDPDRIMNPRVMI